MAHPRSRIQAFLLSAVLLLAGVPAPAQLASNAIHDFMLAHAARPQHKLEAQEAFRSVDEILKWVSNDTGLAIKAEVKRELATRAQMEQYSIDSMHRDGGVEELREAEVVLKKFGLLPRDFQLEPFLLKLLGEQVLAYYAPEKKTVFLLDWVEPAGLRPVLAHELTHALQDQAVDIEKWTKPPGKTGMSPDAAIQDESDMARHGVLEGQGMITMLDFVEEPRGLSALSAVADVQAIIEQMGAGGDSPVYRSAPVYLRETLAFPYRYGMQFERALLSHGGRKLAFEGALQNPPANAWEIMQPGSYLRGDHVPLLAMPDAAALAGERFERVSSGPVGALDVHSLAAQFGKASQAEKLAAEWRGGYYEALREKPASAAEGAALEPAALKLIYVSRWSNAAIAEQFFSLYAQSIVHKYAGARSMGDEKPAPERHIAAWQTAEGEVTMERRGELMAVCEGMPGPLAARLREAALRAAAPVGER
ncbi:MAG: hypothetical protein JO041_10785 [Acidobacteria bacterium]|nr:hypothetical protein [Acidobacteriota bacterium]